MSAVASQVSAEEGALKECGAPLNFEPDLSLEDITNGRLARIIEETRLSRLLQIRSKNERRKLEDGCISSQMKAQMNHDGVVKMTIPGVGKATLLEGRPLHQCENCASAIGEGKRDPYLKVEGA